MLSVLNPVWLNNVESGRENNLNLIRLIAATLVIYSHSYILLGQFDREPMHAALAFGDFGGTAVYVFFFISGYLILKSGIKNDAITFLKARFLRIFPALSVVVFASVFLLGPLTTSEASLAYFQNAQTWSYLFQIILHQNTGKLPMVFMDGREIQTINQPLWTLSSEWSAYMIVLLTTMAVRALIFRRFPSGMTSFLVAIATVFTLQMMPLPWAYTVQWFAFFVLGGVTYIARRYVPLSVVAAAAMIIADLVMIRIIPPIGKVIFPFALTYLVTVIGFHPLVHFKNFHRLGDYSYGLYIFGWPSQQLILPLVYGSPIMLTAMTIPVALILSIALWHFVEKPALSLKRRADPS